MYVVLVEFTVRDPQVEAFVERVRQQARDSLEREPGCRRFDVCVDPAARDRVVLYELYDDREAFDRHLASAHYADFDATVAAWVTDRQVRLLQRL